MDIQGLWPLWNTDPLRGTRFVTARRTLYVSAVFAVARCPSVRPYVRLSVRLSDTLVYCIQAAEDIDKHFSRLGSPMMVVFLQSCDMANGCAHSEIANW